MKFNMVKASEFCDSVRDGTHDSPKRVNKGYKLITSKHIKEYGLDLENAYHISEKDFNKINERSLVEKNDILYSMIGTVGLIHRIGYEPNYAIKNIGLFKLNDEIKSKWLYYYLKSPKMKSYINSLLSGSTQQYITLNNLRNLPIAIPENYIDMIKIIKILELLEKKININAQTNNNLYEIGRAYFENYLESCKEEISIKEVANEILDYHKSKEKKVKLINSSDITENNFPEFEFVDNCNLKGHFKKRFRKYDILYSQIRPRNHHFGYVLFGNTEEYIASTRLMVVRAKEEKISSSLLYYYLTSKEAIEDFTTKTETRSGTFPQGNYGDLSSFKIKYNKNQENITNVLNIVLNRIYSNQLKTKNLEKIRDALLPKLMNGEIDLDKIEI